MNGETQHRLEALSGRRVNLARQYSALSAAALQCLDDGDIEGFLDRVKKRNALAARIDEANAAMEAGIEGLDPADAAVVRTQFAPDARNVACPQWCAALASDWATLRKVLKNCLSMNARMESRARAYAAQMREEHTRVRKNRKLRSRYAAYAGSSGTRISYTSR